MTTPNTFKTGHALIIGTGTDGGGSNSPKYSSTINDAKWLGDVLKNQSLCAYPDNQVRLLCGVNATRQNIEKEFEELSDRILDSEDRKENIVVVFFSGHGFRQDDKAYLVPHGMSSNEPSNAIDGRFLFKKLDAIKAGKILLLLNCCYAAGVDNDQGAKVPLSEGFIKDLRQTRIFCILSAAQAGPTKKRYSPFIIGLSHGFSGKSKEKSADSFVRYNDLMTACSAYLGSGQTSSVNYNPENFAVGHYTEGAIDRFPMLGDAGIEIDIDTDNTDDDLENKQQYKTITTTNFNGTYSGPGMVGNQTFRDGNQLKFN